MTPAGSDREGGKTRLQINTPPEIMECLEAVRAQGGQVWLVGGVVRDGLCGQGSRDWDVATDLPPTELARILPGSGGRDERFGAWRVSLAGRELTLTLTLTTMRQEAGYGDRRHPDAVRFIDDPELDARRRDFTVNALYADPWTGQVLDPCHGLPDLQNRVLRVIGDGVARLREDPLRILRGLRFAASCGLQPSPETGSALGLVAPDLRGLSSERVYQELTAAFVGRGRGRALALMLEWRVLGELLPELLEMPGVPQPPDFHPEGDVFVHVCKVLDEVLPGDPVQAWAAVLHDCGKPRTFEERNGHIRFHGHDQLSAEMADVILRRLAAPRELRETVVEICRDHIRIVSLPEMGRGKRERWLRSPSFPAHLAFHRADCLGSHGKLDIHAAASCMLAELPPEPAPPLCTGADVLALGVEQGPAVGEILRRLEAELESRAQVDRALAMDCLRAIVEDHFRVHGREVDIDS